jgi:hypothetical protein
MRVVRLKKKEVNIKDYVKRSALEEDAELIINQDTLIIDADTEEVVLIYKVLEPHALHDRLFDRLKHVNYQTTQRASGLKTRSRIFGYAPKNRVKTTEQFCRDVKLNREDPATYKLIQEYAAYVDGYYEDNADERYKQHKEETLKVLNNYLIKDTLFTSGIINYNNPLKYHFDAGNFERVFSCMLGFKDGIAGGRLSLPEYNAKLEIQNRSVTLFDGQSILHGVTPIRSFKEDSFRFTIVYYSLVRMWSCLPVDEEITQARQSRWEAELKKMREKFGKA